MPQQRVHQLKDALHRGPLGPAQASGSQAPAQLLGSPGGAEGLRFEGGDGRATLGGEGRARGGGPEGGVEGRGLVGLAVYTESKYGN